MNITKIDWKEDNSRCKCGACNHYITLITFSNGSTWCPTHSEFIAVRDMLEICLLHNLSKDKHCFRAKQKIDIKEILQGGN